MRRKTSLTGAIIIASIVCYGWNTGVAGAAVFERDWKTPGDGLLTYDDVNQREWLDLWVSLLSHFPAPQRDNALAEIQPGGLFDGFTWAKYDDVLGLAQSAGIDVTSLDYATNVTSTSALINMLGETRHFISNVAESAESLGYIDRTGAPPAVGEGAYLSWGHAGIPPSVFSSAGLRFDVVNDNRLYSRVGLMLFRDVPEPATLLPYAIGALVAIFTLSQRRAKRTKHDRVISDVLGEGKGREKGTFYFLGGGKGDILLFRKPLRPLFHSSFFILFHFPFFIFFHLPGPDMIQFAPNLKNATIKLDSGLPDITESVTIDGTDQSIPTHPSLNITIDGQDGYNHMPNDGDGFRIVTISPSADGDDDGDVDQDDYNIWNQNLGHTLELVDVDS